MRIEAGALVAGRYEVERTLGQGGMGAVYLALDRKFGERVALKVAAASGAAHDEFKARFAREARIGHKLGRRRGVVRALDWGELDDGVRLYAAMDLVEGARPLALTAGSRDERLRRLLRAAEIVADAHRQGIVHRDLKPANLLEAADGEVYLADFGLAKLTDDPVADEGSALTAPVTRSGLGFGTPLFMAPEQFDDAKRVDPRADVYALGVMLYLALTGEYPFPGSEPMSIAIKQQKVLEGMAPAPSARSRDASVPEALDRLCAEAMALRLDARLPGADAFAARLREHVAPSAGAGEPPPTLSGAPTVLLAGGPATQPMTTAPATATQPATTPPGSGSRRLRRAAGVVAALGAAWVLLVVLAQFTGAPAVLALRVLPVARLVDFTAPDVVLEAFVTRGDLWSAEREVLLRGSLVDVSPGTYQLVVGRQVEPPRPLRHDEFLQTFEVPLTLPGPGRHTVSLWIQDRGGNETDLSRVIVHHPVTVTLEVLERRADGAVVQGRLVPPPPGPYLVHAGRGAPVSVVEPSFRLEVPLAPGQAEVMVVVQPPLGGAIEARAPLPQ